MKISKILLKNIQQFKDLEIDLTYPKGHKKAGEPLDRVCIIGQSGTGKTTLLKILKNFSFPISSGTFFSRRNKLDYVFFTPKSYCEAKLHYKNISYRQSATIAKTGNYISAFGEFKVNGYSFESYSDIQNNNQYSEITNDMETNFPYVLFFPEGFKHTLGKINADFGVSSEYDFGEINIADLWQKYMYEDVRKWGNELVVKTRNIIKSLKNENEDDISRLRKDLKKWENDNPNPLKKLADGGLDKLLENFNLKLYADLTNENIENFSNLQLQHLKQKDILFQINELNSASQNIIHSSFPLYYLKPNNAIVLYDEIENSLYPDIQQKIIDFYISIAPTNQFFFTTHSPIIASTFDPWEIVELKFDSKTGSVYRDDYIKDPTKERNVDNYKFYPKYLSLDSNLERLFDVPSDYQPERTLELQRLAEIEEEIKELTAIGNKKDEVRKLVEKYKKKADKLDWKL